MRPSDALNHVVSKELATFFGKGLTARIIFAARDASQAPIVGLDATAYKAIIDAIGQDDRVRELWGDHGVETRVQRWKQLADNRR